jgi:hypothetical protein
MPKIMAINKTDFAKQPCTLQARHSISLRFKSRGVIVTETHVNRGCGVAVECGLVLTASEQHVPE